MMRFYLSLFGFLIFSATALPTQAQSADPTPKTRLIPPSPEAANLGRYATSPPSYYTGTPQISVPLAEVVEGPIRLPLSLSYNASGNRVEDMASWVGLGWALNAGGLVTRAVRGAADDQQPSSYANGTFANFFDVSRAFSYDTLRNASTNGLALHTATALLVQAAQGCADTQPDVFYFNFNGYTGQFSFDWNRQIRVSSAKDVRIEPVFNTPGATVRDGSFIRAWRMTTEDGMVYEFSDAEYTNNKPYSRSAGGCIPAGGHRFISSWYLSSITDANREHWVRFDYTSYLLNYDLRFNETIETAFGDCANITDIGTDRSSRSYLSITGLRLGHIRTSSGNVEVELLQAAAGRTDTLGLRNARNRNLHALDHLVVRNAAGAETKAVFLNYYPNNPTGRLTLQGVQKGTLAGARLPGHAFLYNAAEPLPADIRSLAQDHWGYYNRAVANEGLRYGKGTLLPACTLTTPSGRVIVQRGADREVAPQAAQAGILTKIVYPTGGYSTYEYESNEYGYVNDATLLSLGHTSTVPRGYAVSAAGGEEGPPTGPPGAGRKYFEHKVAFRLRESKLISISWSLYTTNVGGLKPFVVLSDSANPGRAIIRAIGGVGGSPGSNAVRMLAPGRYTLTARAYQPVDPNDPPTDDPNTGGHGTDAADISVSYDSTVAAVEKKYAGGLRVKKVQDFASTSDAHPSARVFDYTELGHPNGSSGCIYGEAKYAYLSQYMWAKTNGTPNGLFQPTICDCWFRIAHNRTSLGSTQGSTVGYREVTVTTLADRQPNSQSVYRFTSPAEYPDDIIDELPFPPATSQSHRTGLLKEQTDFRGTGSSRTPLRRTTTQYRFYEASTPGLAVAYPNSLSPGITISGYLPLLREEYGNVSGHAQPDSVRETQFDNTGTAEHTQLKTYAYDLAGTRLQTEGQQLANGVKKLVRHWYSAEFAAVPASPYARMARDLHVIAPVESVTLLERGDTATVIAASFHEFGFEGPKLRPLAERRLRTAAPIPTSAYVAAAASGAAGLDPRLELFLTIDAYDVAGNVTQLHQAQGPPVARLWGYGRAYLLAEVQNATYADLMRVLGQPAVDQLVGPTPGTDAAVQAALQPLRTQLSQAQVTTYTYRPLVGLTSQTDPTGRVTTYEYDDFGRLLRTRDEQGRILSQQQYHYARP